MKALPHKPLVALRFFGIFLCALVCWASPARAAGWRAGLAQIDITPPTGHRMAGYFDERLSTGTHDPLLARAIVLQHGREKIALVSCDLVGVSLNVSTNARAQASRKTGISVRNILITATHSHTGPLFDDPRRDFFHQQAMEKLGRDPQEEIYYPAFLAERLVTVIAQANSRLAAAQIATGVTRQEGLAFNRRFHMKNGTVAFNPGQLNPNIIRAAGPVDEEVGLLFVHSADGNQALGCLTVFACHCDTVGGTEYSADYPYYLSETLKQTFGAQFIAAFAPGTCGDINHINVAVKESVKGLALTERIGVTLGTTVLAAHPDLAVSSKPALAVRSRTLVLPLQEVSAEAVAAARAKMPSLREGTGGFIEKVEAVKAVDLAARGTTLPMEVQVFRLDADTAIVGLPGEIFVELGLAIKKASPFKHTIVMSLCNDRPAYVPTLKAFSEGSYEVVNSRIQPGGGEKMVAAAVEMLTQLKPRK
jgi:neutral ceramidase